MIFVHKTADVSKKAVIGSNTKIWHQAQIHEGVSIGRDCIIGKGVYIDKGVTVGNRVKIQNYASIYHGTILEDGAFVGPYVCFTNDRYPRAITVQGTLKTDEDWKEEKTLVKKGAAIGAGSIILPGVCIGEYAFVGAGSVVTKDVLRQTVVFGNPATIRGMVCICGVPLHGKKTSLKLLLCPSCQSKR
jgi:UDP-2-acetamido-3-amino-2,3-dideoxy-glucuronate N-acetyltransferase